MPLLKGKKAKIKKNLNEKNKSDVAQDKALIKSMVKKKSLK